MILINPQPESSPPIIKPRKDETLRSWLTRKNHALMFYSWYPNLYFDDNNFGVIIPSERELIC